MSMSFEEIKEMLREAHPEITDEDVKKALDELIAAGFVEMEVEEEA